MKVLAEKHDVDASELGAIDARVAEEIDRATDEAEASPMPEPTDSLVGIYADPPVEQPLWFREGVRAAVDVNERPQGWGTHDA
jgi:TPP-dependent pyruvate/acetoin dehydrogenase alpha subunit